MKIKLSFLFCFIAISGIFSQSCNLLLPYGSFESATNGSDNLLTNSITGSGFISYIGAPDILKLPFEGQCFIKEVEKNHANTDYQVLGASSGQGISFFIEGGIESEKNYMLRFSQINIRSFYSDRMPNSAKWKAQLDCVISGSSPKTLYGESVYLPINDKLASASNWSDGVIVFKNDITSEITSCTLKIFVSDDLNIDPNPYNGYSCGSTDQFNSTNNYLLIDDVSLTKEGDCVEDPDIDQQDNSSFMPNKNTNYWVSAWVKEEQTTQVKTYTSGIEISFADSSTTFTFSPTGKIIDGWQRIEGNFTIPTGAKAINLALLNNLPDVNAVYFDDIRIHKSEGNMKSFVYDEQTERLMAELDENNYATFYEYDLEGGLVRVKKETEKGVYTIQETRSNTFKK